MKWHLLFASLLLTSCNLGDYGLLAYIETLNVSKDSNLPKSGAMASSVGIVSLSSGKNRYFVAMGKLYWRDADGSKWNAIERPAKDLAKISDTQLAVASSKKLSFLDPAALTWQEYDIATLPGPINAIFYLSPNLYVHTGAINSYSFYQIAPGGSALHGFGTPQGIFTASVLQITDAVQHNSADYFLHNGVTAYSYSGTNWEAFTTLPTDKKGFTGLTSLNLGGGSPRLYMSMGTFANSGNDIFENPDASAHSAGSFNSLSLSPKNYKFLTSGNVGGTIFLMAAVGDREIAFVNPAATDAFSLYAIPTSYRIVKDSSRKLHRLLSYDPANNRLFFSTDQNGLFSMKLSLTGGKVSVTDFRYE